MSVKKGFKEAVAKYYMLSEEKKKIENELEEVKDLLYCYMHTGDQIVCDINNNIYMLRYQLIEKILLDSKKLKEERPKIFNQYSYKSEYKIFTLRPASKEDTKQYKDNALKVI